MRVRPHAGRGIAGIVIPGCPETFQSFQEERFQEGQQGQSSRDEHQRILHFREGDVIALPAGVTHWCYNNGDRPVIAITVVDISNNANQLDRNHRVISNPVSHVYFYWNTAM